MFLLCGKNTFAHSRFDSIRSEISGALERPLIQPNVDGAEDVPFSIHGEGEELEARVETTLQSTE